MKERNIQNEIRLALSREGVTTFRANSGQAWTSNEVVQLPNGDILLRNPRPFQAMMPGFSDLFGITPRIMTEADVGKTVGIFTAVECKSLRGQASDKQKHFLDFVKKSGGLAGVARSVDDALAIICESSKHGTDKGNRR